MKRALLFAAAITALAVALPATAGAATLKGIVIAKKPARKALVIVSPNGVVRTVRAREAYQRVPVGRMVTVQGAALPDGTFAAGKVRISGKARRVHFRGTVVAVKGPRLFISAGGSVFALRVRSGAKTGASEGSGGLAPGDEVDCDASVKGGLLETRGGDLNKVGHSDKLVLEGIYLATAGDGTIELAVVHHGRVFVKVPAGTVVPTFAPGDQIALVVTVETDGSFTLVKAENEEGGDTGDGDVDINAPKSQFTVVGVLAALSADAVTVKLEEHHEPVRCAVPDGFDLSGFVAGQRVLMTCKFQDGHPVLLSLKKKDGESEYLEAAGKITDLGGTITVQADGHDPASCAVPEGFDVSGYAVGDLVVMFCKKLDGVWTLKAIKHKEPPPPEYLVFGGAITALTSDTISVQADGHDPVTCAVPAGADLSAFNVNDHVTMKCVYVDGGLRLKGLKSDTAEYWAP
ncbi:MAG: hypothetical protein WBB76_03315 [Gaiellaceae bacterium]